MLPLSVRNVKSEIVDSPDLVFLCPLAFAVLLLNLSVQLLKTTSNDPLGIASCS